MKLKYCRPAVLIISFMVISLFVPSCSKREQKGVQGKDHIVIAVGGDVDSFNPLFAEGTLSGEINDLLFPGLVDSRFDTARGILEYQPLLASSWEFQNGNRDILFHLRSGALWSDGTPVTAHDVQVSYILYGDSVVASIRQSSVDGLRRTKGGVLNIREAVEVLNDSTVVFHFERPYPAQMFDAGLPIIPAHVFEHLPRADVRSHPVNQKPISSGPFMLESWKPMQEIVLSRNTTSSLPYPARCPRLVFRIIPDYRSRLEQLKSGDVDVVSSVRIEDVAGMDSTRPQLHVLTTGERFYDAINWNNIDPEEYAKSRHKAFRPHPLFGSATVRRALTMAINRKEIADSYLGSYGREAFGPISPLFRWAYNDTLKPLPYDPSGASALLAAEGWRDTNGDKVLDKNGRAFYFVLKIPGGDQLRSSVATIVQNQLRAVNVDVRIEQVERAAFMQSLMERSNDAWIGGFSVPLQMELDEIWGSDLERSPFNFIGFRNKQVDRILRGAKRVAKETDYANSWKEFQVILQREQPRTFLYWKNDLVVINTRVKGTAIGILGLTHHAWDWHLEGNGASHE